MRAADFDRFEALPFDRPGVLIDGRQGARWSGAKAIKNQPITDRRIAFTAKIAAAV